VICEALGQGLQSLILRKGGIHEGPGGFQVEHREFWLFPTYLHQRADALVEEAWPLLERVQREAPPPHVVRIRLFAVVYDVFEVREPDVVAHLAGLHAWSARTVIDRFNYKRPGLFVLPVRTYRLVEPIELPNSEYFAGCRSWVELPNELPTTGAEPVLSDADFAEQLAAIRRAVTPMRLA
jgi:hypothetical protein